MSKTKSRYQNDDGTFKEFKLGGKGKPSAFNGCVLHMMHEEGHSEESAKAICGKIAHAVGNDETPIAALMLTTREGENYRLALDNDAAIDEEGWGLIAPFGEHPKTRLFREGGQVKEQHFIQVLDNESADAMLAKENSFFRTLKRALVGIPVYRGHGDLNDTDPQAVANESEKIKLGVVDKIRKGPRGIEAHFALDNDGAEAVDAGWKFPSAFWWVLPSGTRALANGIQAILAKPFKLISVALTPHPNISGVESLANARQQLQTRDQTTDELMLKENLTGLLIGRGVTLPPNPTEQQLLAALANGAAAEDDDQGPEPEKLSRKAHLASARAKDKAGHSTAASAHSAAQDAHEENGDDETAGMHGAMMKHHMRMAAK